MGKVMDSGIKEGGWMPSIHRHKHGKLKKKPAFSDSIQIQQNSPLDGIQINGQKMATPRKGNGYEEEDSIEVVKKMQQFSSALVTSMLMANIKDVTYDKHHSNLEDLTIDHVPCAVYERLNNRPYVSFVGTAPTVEKLCTSLREHQREAVEESWCSRYDEHMKLFEHKAKRGIAPNLLHPEHSFIKHTIRALKKKEALRRRALEQLELRRQRKTYSSALYNTDNAGANVYNKLFRDRGEPIPGQKVRFPAGMPDSKVRFHMPDTNISPRELVVSEDEDYLKSLDDIYDKKDMLITPENSVKESSSSEADIYKSIEDTNTSLSTKEIPDQEVKLEKENVGNLKHLLYSQKKKEKQDIEQVSSKNEKLNRFRSEKNVIDEEETRTKTDNVSPPSATVEIQQSLTSVPSKGVRWLDQHAEPKKIKKAPKKEITHLKPPSDVKPTRSKTKPYKVKSKSKDFKDEKHHMEECGTLINEDTIHSVATIEDTKTGPLSLTVATDETPKREESPPPPPLQRKRSVVKKQFLPRVKSRVEQQREEIPSPEIKPQTPEREEPEEVAKTPSPEPPPPAVELDEPPLPDLPKHECKESKTSLPPKTILRPITKLEQKLSQTKRRQFMRDTSYEEELRRQEEAERLRQKQMEMLEKMKNRSRHVGGEINEGDETRKFDNYGFLAKYCIFHKGSMESYRRTFDSVDEKKRGWLNGVEVMIALRGINQNISYNEEEYLYRVLEATGYNVSTGADFKLFAVMAALSLKISSLDSWMKNMIGRMDFKTLDTKMHMCKKLWECNVDPETNKISIEQLCIELRAGGISPEHEAEVRTKLAHLKALDLLDFLTYIPLFILIHESVIDNPFDESRQK